MADHNEGGEFGKSQLESKYDGNANMWHRFSVDLDFTYDFISVEQVSEFRLVHLDTF